MAKEELRKRGILPGSKKQKANAARRAIAGFVKAPMYKAPKQGKSRKLTVQSGRRGPSAPTQLGYKNGSRQTYFRSKRPSLKGATAAFEGCDFLGSEVSASTLQDVYFTVSPIASVFAKLAIIAPVFAMFRFTKLRVIVEGKAPSTVPGIAAVSGEYDAPATPVAWTQSQVRNQEGVKVCKFWEDLTYSYDTKKNSYNWYHHEPASGSEVASQESQGTIHIVLDGISTTLYTAGNPLVDIWIEYEIEFAESIQAAAPQVDLVTSEALKNEVFRGFVANLAAKTIDSAKLLQLRKRQNFLAVHHGSPRDPSEDNSAIRQILGKVDSSLLPSSPAASMSGAPTIPRSTGY